MKRKIVGICICMLMIVAVIVPAAGTTNKENIFGDKSLMEFVPGEFIVKLKKDATFANPTLKMLNEKYMVSGFEKVFPHHEGTILDNIFLLHVPIESNILSIVQTYSSCPVVEYAEPNTIGKLGVVPNDENFWQQWDLNNYGQYGGTPDADIDAPEAWNITRGDSEVVIASVDSGIDYTHPDLSSRIWNNIDEIPGNSIDDDGNGFIDDICGWDFVENDNEPLDRHGHGTYCAGIHGMMTNNTIGAAGVDWNCKTMVLRGANTTAYPSLYAQGIVYAADNGADIINIEMYSYSPWQVIEDAINYAYGKNVFCVACAGNDNTSQKSFPAAYDNVTAVAATNNHDERCDGTDWAPGYGSNYGDWVDIAAPGWGIYSTLPTYENFWWYTHEGFPLNYIRLNFSGTSSAAPHVAGVAALLLSMNPLLEPDVIKSLICNNVDPYNSPEYIGTGRINAQKALTALLQSQPTADFTWTPQDPLTNQPITFDASASQDPDGTITLYEWDWDNDSIYDETHSSPTATHIWTEEGYYPVTLQVTDEDGIPDTEIKMITVYLNQPPDNPTITGPENGKPGSNYKYTITGTDPEEDMVSAYIMWGDDTITNWTTYHNSEEAFSVTHTWAKKGTYTVQVKVKDTHGAESGWTTLSVTMPFSYNIPFESFWMKLFERFPHAFPILRYLTGF